MKIANPLARRGEDAAVAFLKQQGYTIIERNFSGRYGEIDIIVLDPDKTLVFVEVKTRTSAQYGNPLEAITPWKVKTVIKTAEFYQLLHPNLPKQVRIDAIGVAIVSGSPVIEHVKNITS